jgi:hypothetical protein
MSDHARRIVGLLLTRAASSLIPSLLNQSRNIHLHLFEVQSRQLILLLLIELQVMLPHLEHRANLNHLLTSTLRGAKNSWSDIVDKVSRWTPTRKSVARAQSDEKPLRARATQLKTMVG